MSHEVDRPVEPAPDGAATPPETVLSPRVWWVWLAIYWAVVLGLVVEHVPPSEFPLEGATGPVQALLWVIGVLWLLRRLRGWRHARAVRLAVTIMFLGLGVGMINWAVWSPRWYYNSHKYAFDAIARGIDDGRVGSPIASGGGEPVDGVALPLPTGLVSATGTAVTVGAQQSQRIVFIPEDQWVLGGASGYVYLNGPMPQDGFEIFLKPANTADAINLGDGWWYVTN